MIFRPPPHHNDDHPHPLTTLTLMLIPVTTRMLIMLIPICAAVLACCLAGVLPGSLRPSASPAQHAHIHTLHTQTHRHTGTQTHRHTGTHCIVHTHRHTHTAHKHTAHTFTIHNKSKCTAHAHIRTAYNAMHSQAQTPLQTLQLLQYTIETNAQHAHTQTHTHKHTPSHYWE